MRPSRFLTATAVAALLLSGCSDDEPTPEFSDDVTASSTAADPSTTPVTESSPTAPVEPALPAEAEEATKAGAEAFVRYYVELIDFAQASGDVRGLTDAASRSCGTCSAGARSIERIHERGGRIAGGTHDVSRLSSSESSGLPGTWIVLAHIDVGRQIVRGAGDLDAVYPAGTTKVAFTVQHDSGRWQVTSWDVV